jgi:hypothetical protein
MASSRAPREIIGIRQRYLASSARILRATFSPCNWRALTISSPDLRTRCPLKGGYGAAQRDAGRVGRGIWRAATWHLGFIAPASGRAGRRSSVQTTRTRIGRRQHRGARVSRRFTQKEPTARLLSLRRTLPNTEFAFVMFASVDGIARRPIVSGP